MASGGVASAREDRRMFQEITVEPEILQESSNENIVKINEEPDVMLSDGMPLPKYLRNDFPDSLFGRPIHEIDPFYSNKNTFVVIGTNWEIHRFSSLKSLGLLTPLNRLRWFCIRAITHLIFRIFIFVIVVVYSIYHHEMIQIRFHIPVLMVFALEMSVKIIAHGFVLQPFSYLRNPWNWIDFLLNLFGIFFSLTIDVVQHYFHFIHSFRTLRLIHIFTHSRLTYSALFRNLCRMGDVFLYGGFLLFLFTIGAQQLFGGAFKTECVHEMRESITLSHAENVSELPSLCGNVSGSRNCPTGFICIKNTTLQNPENGYTSFDNFPLAVVSIVRLMGRDFWDVLFIQIHATLGPWSFAFFLTVIVFGSYYYINLLLAYIAVEITELLQMLEENKLKKKPVKHKKLNDLDASEKENENKGVAENDVTQAVNAMFIDQGTEQRNKEGDKEGVIELEHVSISDTGDEKQDEVDGEKLDIYRPRRNPIAIFCMSLVDRFCDWNCCPCWVGFKEKLAIVVLSIYFNVFIVICIISNIVIAAIEYHHDIAFDMHQDLHIAENIFRIIYIIEAISKILAFSPKHYFKDWMNVFDFIIVVDIICELILENLGVPSVLRLFRAFRILRLARWWPLFDKLLKICGTSVWAFCVVIYMFTIMAVGIFKEHYYAIGSLDSRWNFKSDMNSLLTLIRIICGELIETIWECSSGDTSSYCIPFLYTFAIIGNLALFTLLITMLAVALHSSDFTETQPIDNRNLISVVKNFFLHFCHSTFFHPKRLEEQTTNKSREELFDMSADGEAQTTGGAQLTVGEDVIAPCWCHICYRFFPSCGSPYTESSTVASATSVHTSLWGKWSSLRSRSFHLINHKYFGYGMIAFIILSCIPVTWNDPGHDHIGFYTAFFITNYFVVFIYPLDICLQMFGLGCKKYFSCNWHLFDFVITVLHITSLLLPSESNCVVLLFAFGFRPLKLIARLKQLQVVVSAIFYKLSSFLDVLLACGILWLFFALCGMVMFAGRFSSCINQDGSQIRELDHGVTIDYWDCLYDSANGSGIQKWENPDHHFDSLYNAFLALLHVATVRGWITIVHRGIDVKLDGSNSQPVRESSTENIWYFVAFFVLGVLCCFSLILATFLRKSNDQRKQIRGYIEILMTEDQRKEFARKRGAFFTTLVNVPSCPEWWPRRFAYQLVVSSSFKLVFIILTLLNAIGLALITFENNMQMASTIFAIDAVFFLAFALEVLLRSAAFGCEFFKRSWNIYDFVVFAVTLIVFIFHPFLPKHLPTPLLFGVFRAARLVRWLKWIRRIGSRLVVYLTALGNVALLLLVVIYTYAVVGNTMFGNVPHSPMDIAHPEWAHVGSGMLSMTMIAFGGSWDMVIDKYAGSRWFVLSFLTLVDLIFIEAGAVLFLEHYHLLKEKRRLGLSDGALETFQKAWKILDPNATGYISYDHLSEFLQGLLPPLQIITPNFDQIAVLDVPIYKDDNVAFNDVLLALLARLDNQGKIVKSAVQNQDDVISSTLKRQQVSVEN